MKGFLVTLALGGAWIAGILMGRSSAEAESAIPYLQAQLKCLEDLRSERQERIRTLQQHSAWLAEQTETLRATRDALEAP